MIPVIPEQIALNARPNRESEIGSSPIGTGAGLSESVNGERFDGDFNALVEFSLQAASDERPPAKPELPVVEIAELQPTAIDTAGSELPVSGKDLPTRREFAPPHLPAAGKVARPAISGGDRPELARSVQAARDPQQIAEDPPLRAARATQVTESSGPSSAEASPTDRERPSVVTKIAFADKQPAPTVEKTAVRETKRAASAAQRPPKHAASEGIVNQAVSAKKEPDQRELSAAPAQTRAEVQRPAITDETRLVATPLDPVHSRADLPIPHEVVAATALPKIAERPSSPKLQSELAKAQKPGSEASLNIATTIDAPVATKGSTPALLVQSPIEPIQSIQAQPASPPTANSVVSSAPNLPSPLADTRVEARVIPQIEQAIDALTDAREAGRVSRPEMVLRHGEFGMVNMRLEAVSGDLRAILSSRDPGFVPAIQAALGERAVSASSEPSTNHNSHRGQDQNAGTTAHSGGGNSPNYGSSPGSSQGSSQPRLPQHEATRQDADSGDREEAGGMPHLGVGASGLFA